MPEQSTARRTISWLTQSADATEAATDTPTITSEQAETAGDTPSAALAGRPRKAERRRARRAEFFAARRNQATTVRARFEVAVDHLRAAGTDRDLVEATEALEQIAGRRP